MDIQGVDEGHAGGHNKGPEKLVGLRIARLADDGTAHHGSDGEQGEEGEGVNAAFDGGLPVDRQLLLFDIPLMSAVAVGAIPVFFTGRRVGRAEGGLGVAIYLTYLMWLVFYRS